MVGKSVDVFRLKIDGRWLNITKDFLAKHPGGSIITQYRDTDATHAFHAFHEGSDRAYKQLRLIQQQQSIIGDDISIIDNASSTTIPHIESKHKSTTTAATTNISTYNVSPADETRILSNFEKLRQKMHHVGLMRADEEYYIAKTCETMSIVVFAFVLQYLQWYWTSACVLALGWQQLGWLTHEFCHHQPMKNRHANDTMSLFLGNIMQGYSRDWWKERHNTHHAATNMIGRDDDIDLAPLIAMVPDDLKKYKSNDDDDIGTGTWSPSFFLKLIPYQHIYFTFTWPALRLSWALQSVVFSYTAVHSNYRAYRRHATVEQLALGLHWLWVAVQLWLLPSNSIRIGYFLISQFGAGMLIAHVVTFSHNSVDKFEENSRLINNFVCLHVLTTRNMQSSAIIDWLWGGLNYQIEHHLFPTMPRPNLPKASILVRQFCADNNLPYMCDNYSIGFRLCLQQLATVGRLAVHALKQHSRPSFVQRVSSK